MANPDARDARPHLVRIGGEAPEAREAASGALRGILWVLAGLLACAIGAAALQTDRLGRMTLRAEQLAAESAALRVQLTDAQAQIATFEKQQDLVRESVADLAGRVAALYEIVQPVGSPAPAPGAEPAAEPAR